MIDIVVVFASLIIAIITMICAADERKTSVRRILIIIVATIVILCLSVFFIKMFKMHEKELAKGGVIDDGGQPIIIVDIEYKGERYRVFRSSPDYNAPIFVIPMSEGD